MVTRLRSRVVRSTGALALLALLAGAETHFSLATLNIVWRMFVLSFDNPATLWNDDVASDGRVSSDPAREAHDAVRRGVEPGPLHPIRYAPPRANHRFASVLTRAPPSSSLA